MAFGGLPRFDMEDAMILNKSAVERGLHYGQVYKVSDGRVTT